MKKITTSFVDVKLDVPSIGAGVMRTSATWIALMLMAEPDKVQTLASVMKELRITPEQVSEVFYDAACDMCGASILGHDEREKSACSVARESRHKPDGGAV